MKLQVQHPELIWLLHDVALYGDCDHYEHDSCCYVCQSKRIVEAHKNGELVVNGKEIVAADKDITNKKDRP